MNITLRSDSGSIVVVGGQPTPYGNRRRRWCTSILALSKDLRAPPSKEQSEQHVRVHALQASQFTTLKYGSIIAVNRAPTCLLLDEIGAGLHRIGISSCKRWIVLAPAIDGDSVYPENFLDLSKRVTLAEQVESQRFAAPGR
jgi:hypothetical protein